MHPNGPVHAHTPDVIMCVRRSVNCDSLDLEQEVDPLNVDHFSCTPLVTHFNKLP